MYYQYSKVIDIYCNYLGIKPTKDTLGRSIYNWQYVERPYHGNKKQILIGYDYFLKFSPMYP
jgi:hypothetical protein